MSKLTDKFKQKYCVVERYTIETTNKYVEEIYDMSAQFPDGTKAIEICVIEQEDSSAEIHKLPVDNWPDLVHIVPLKHQYDIFLIYQAW